MENSAIKEGMKVILTNPSQYKNAIEVIKTKEAHQKYLYVAFIGTGGKIILTQENKRTTEGLIVSAEEIEIYPVLTVSTGRNEEFIESNRIVIRVGEVDYRITLDKFTNGLIINKFTLDDTSISISPRVANEFLIK